MLNIEKSIPLAQFTTLNIGGPAKYFCRAESKEDLIEALKFAQEKNLPYIIVGGGSNLLISDEGFPGLVIKNELTGIKPSPASQGWTLQGWAGTQLFGLVDFAIKNGLAGMEKLTGIPGTLGGAVFGNAGAYGQTISDHIIKVVCLNPNNNQIITLSKDQCQFAYRDSTFKKNGLIILEACFNLPTGNAQNLQQSSQEILTQRLSKYPSNLKCPGSFFKNIPLEKIPKESLELIPKDKITYGKAPAAVLLDLVGARGQKVGDIEVSKDHANLIINTRKGKASDFYQLAQSLIKKVRDKFGVTLEPEVQLVNLPP